MDEVEAGRLLLDLLSKPCTSSAVKRSVLLAPMFTSCPACGAEPWVNIDCDTCEVMSSLTADARKTKAGE
jgi:hypothetical protein